MFAGPALSGVLADGLGMAGMFVITGGMCALAAVATWRLHSERKLNAPISDLLRACGLCYEFASVPR